MLIDLLAHHARWSGDKLAIESGPDRRLDYAQTYGAVLSFASAIQRDLPQLVEGAPIAVAIADRRVHFLFTLALEFLGIASLPFVIPLDPGVADGLLHCGFVVADHEIAGLGSHQILLEPCWLQQAEFTPVTPGLKPVRWQSNDIVSLIVTSGSSGVAKCIRLGFKARLLRECNRAWRYGFSPDTRYLIGLPISVSNVFISARAVLRSGGSLVFVDNQPVEQLFSGITHTTLLPSHVRTILDALPDDYRHPQPLRLLSVGAPLAAELRERAERMLNAEVESNYGCNELGGVGLIDRAGIGYLFPGTEMKLVDINQLEVAAGQSGLIWLRSEEIAEGYTDEASTRLHFVDGWFVTGDIGMMLGHRTFRLLGRADTLMNLGGQKVAPDVFESGLAQLGIARDVAVTSIPGPQGIEQICVCLEQPRVGNDELLKQIRAIFGVGTGEISVIFVDQIPRNATGKIQRHQMHEIAMARIAG